MDACTTIVDGVSSLAGTFLLDATILVVGTVGLSPFQSH